MTFPQASRFADDHDVVLVGYRGVDGSSGSTAPRSSSALQALDRLPQPEVVPRVRAGVPGLRGRGSQATASTSPATRSPSGSTTSRPPATRSATAASTSSARAPGTRTAMIYAWRYPKSIHRSVMIGVNPPGHFLWDAKTTDEQIGRYAAPLRAGRDLQQADGRPRGVDARGRPRTSPSRWLFLPIEKGNVADRRVLRADGDDRRRRRRSPAPMTIDSLALRGEGRRERALAPVADGRAGVPRRVRLGRRGRRRPRRRRAPRALLRRRPRAAARSSATPAPTSSGPAAAWSTPGRPTRTRTSTRACGLERARRS